jgi:hypothetical protein
MTVKQPIRKLTLNLQESPVWGNFRVNGGPERRTCRKSRFEEVYVAIPGPLRKLFQYQLTSRMVKLVHDKPSASKGFVLAKVIEYLSIGLLRCMLPQVLPQPTQNFWRGAPMASNKPVRYRHTIYQDGDRTRPRQQQICRLH